VHSNPSVSGGTFGEFERRGLPIELGIGERLGAQSHREGELRGHGTDEGSDLGRVREFLFEVLKLPQEVTIAMSCLTGAWRYSSLSRVGTPLSMGDGASPCRTSQGTVHRGKILWARVVPPSLKGCRR